MRISTMRRWLIAAGIYNLLWGAFVVLYPTGFFRLLGIDPPTPISIWQCLGMVIGVYGIGYLAASIDPIRHWPIVLVGFLGKIFGPIGFVWTAARGEIPWSFGLTIPTNDLLWWIPFALILRAAWLEGTRDDGPVAPLDEALRAARTQRGESLDELSRRGRVLAVALRHLGCTFCRETLSEVAARRAELESAGARIVLVHTHDDDAETARFLARYRLDDLDRIMDPTRTLVRALGLRRGTAMQLFGPKVFLRGAVAFLRGHGLGALQGDPFQMPGAFVIEHGAVIAAHRPTSVAERATLCT
jgi:hypothetical protein